MPSPPSVAPAFLKDWVFVKPSRVGSGDPKIARGKNVEILVQDEDRVHALGPRLASCMEFLAQCNARKAKESNPSCQIQVKRRTDDFPSKITVTFVNGVEETFNATSTAAQHIRSLILQKGQYLETEQMFGEAGEEWPVIIPEEELLQPFTGIKPRKAEERQQ